MFLCKKIQFHNKVFLPVTPLMASIDKYFWSVFIVKPEWKRNKKSTDMVNTYGLD